MSNTSKARKSTRTAKATKRHATGNPTKTPRRSAASRKTEPPARAGTKQAILIELLKRPEGATIAEMAARTGWQAHSVRGAISGTLKKKLGLMVTSEKPDDGPRRYRMVAAKS